MGQFGTIWRILGLDLGQFTAISGILGLDWVYSGLFGDILGHFGPISGVMGLDLGVFCGPGPGFGSFWEGYGAGFGPIFMFWA